MGGSRSQVRIPVSPTPPPLRYITNNHITRSKEKKQIREKEKKSSRRAKSSSGRGEAYSSRDSYDDRRGGGDGYDSAEDASDDSYAQRRPARREKEGRRDSRRKPTPRHEDDGDEGEDPIELGNTRPTGIGI